MQKAAQAIAVASSPFVFNNDIIAIPAIIYALVMLSLIHILRGVNMTGIPGTPGQDYERFQPDLMVYHDAIHDYSTNEPTMDLSLIHI